MHHGTVQGPMSGKGSGFNRALRQRLAGRVHELLDENAELRNSIAFLEMPYWQRFKLWLKGRLGR